MEVDTKLLNMAESVDYDVEGKHTLGKMVFCKCNLIIHNVSVCELYHNLSSLFCHIVSTIEEDLILIYFSAYARQLDALLAKKIDLLNSLRGEAFCVWNTHINKTSH